MIWIWLILVHVPETIFTRKYCLPAKDYFYRNYFAQRFQNLQSIFPCLLSVGFKFLHFNKSVLVRFLSQDLHLGSSNNFKHLRIDILFLTFNFSQN